MSSTLFGRGTLSQIGSANRAETINREIADIRALLLDIKQVPAIVRELSEMVTELKNRIDLLNIPELAPPITREELNDIIARVEAVRVLQVPTVTPAMLTALERRMDATFERRIASLTTCNKT